MSAHYEDLVNRLEQGPNFLLLGQKYLSLESGEDPLVGPVSRAADDTTGQLDLYQLLLRVKKDRKEAVLSALASAASELTAPAWLGMVAGLPWNGVFSTAVDSMFLRALRNEWRQVQPVASSAFRPSAPRSTSQVQAVLLFGGADQPPESWPPTGKLELGARRSEARALAQRLPDELITPRGVLVIEAWGVDDWFSPEDLYGVLHRLGHEQAHLFSATSAELADEYIAAAVEGRHPRHPRRGLRELRRGRQAPRTPHRPPALRHGRPPDPPRPRTARGAARDLEHGRLLRAAARRGPPHRTARPVARAALSEVPRVPRRDGVVQHLVGGRGRPAVPPGLRDRAARPGRRGARQPRLPGTTAAAARADGSGKTIALASLAHAIAREGQHAVVRHPAPREPPLLRGDRLVLRVGREGVHPDHAPRLGRHGRPRRVLPARQVPRLAGRRAVLVGSCYRTDDTGKATRHVVQAPPR